MYDKNVLREKMMAKRQTLSLSYKKKAEDSILQKLISSDEYQQAKMIFCYLGTKDEMNTSLFIKQFFKDGKRVCLPKVMSKTEMEIREITSTTEFKNLEKSRFGILEPSNSHPVVLKEAIDLAIVPCVTATKSGYRLGYGGGYYDRYLNGSTSYNILCLWEDLISIEVPIEDHDEVVDRVITEKY